MGGSEGGLPPQESPLPVPCPPGGSGGLGPPGISVNYPCLASAAAVPCPRALPQIFFRPNFFVGICSSEFFRPNFFVGIFSSEFFRRNFFVRIFFVRFFRRSGVRPSVVRPSEKVYLLCSIADMIVFIEGLIFVEPHSTKRRLQRLKP